MSAKDFRSILRLGVLSSIVGLATIGPANAQGKLKCGDWSVETVEAAVSSHLARRWKVNPNHPIAAPFFKTHVFRRDQFRYEEYQDGIWVAPFVIQDSMEGRAKEYAAVVDCRKHVEFSGSLSSAG